MLLLYSYFLKKSLQFANFLLFTRCLDVTFSDFLCSICLRLNPQYWYVADLVVILNKAREETFAASLQNRKSCACIKLLALVGPPNLFAFICFFSKKMFSPQRMFMSCLCLRHGAHVNSTSSVFVHLLIIFLGRDWFGFFLNKCG